MADQVPSGLLKQGLLPAAIEHSQDRGSNGRARSKVVSIGLARVKQPANMVAFIRQHVYKPEYKHEAAASTAS